MRSAAQPGDAGRKPALDKRRAMALSCCDHASAATNERALLCFYALNLSRFLTFSLSIFLLVSSVLTSSSILFAYNFHQ